MRLTKKEIPQLKNFMEDNVSINDKTAIKRLWNYENFMDKYGFTSIEDLERLLDNSDKIKTYEALKTACDELWKLEYCPYEECKNLKMKCSLCIENYLKEIVNKR